MTGRTAVLLWLERALLAIGVALALWAALVFAQERFFQSLPIPGPRAATARVLPGDAGNDGRGVPDTTGHAGRRAGDWIARLEAPTVHLTATVLEGSGAGTLARAAGHIEGTAFPGENGNVGVAAHRDTIFRPVRNLKLGDPLIVTTRDHVFEYRVGSTTIVKPEDVYVLDPTGHPTLTLVTCYPFNFIGRAPRRFIVQAQLIAKRPR
jgi:sortase A